MASVDTATRDLVLRIIGSHRRIWRRGQGQRTGCRSDRVDTRRLRSKTPEPGRDTGGPLISWTRLKEVFLHGPHRLAAWFQLGVHLPLGVRSGGSAWASPYNL